MHFKNFVYTLELILVTDIIKDTSIFSSYLYSSIFLGGLTERGGIIFVCSNVRINLGFKKVKEKTMIIPPLFQQQKKILTCIECNIMACLLINSK